MARNCLQNSAKPDVDDAELSSQLSAFKAIPVISVIRDIGSILTHTGDDTNVHVKISQRECEEAISRVVKDEKFVKNNMMKKGITRGDEDIHFKVPKKLT